MSKRAFLAVLATLLISTVAIAQLTQAPKFLGRLGIYDSDSQSFPTIELDPHSGTIRIGDGASAPSDALTLDKSSAVVTVTGTLGDLTVEDVVAQSLRAGTGSTPDVTPGADDIFIEGTAEIDGATRIDGAVDINAAVDVSTTLDVGGNATFSANVAQDSSDGALTTQYVVRDASLTDLSSSATLSGVIPAGSIVLGVTVRVTTLITASGGGASFSIGDGSDADRWGTGIAFAADTVTSSADFTITSVPIYAAATNVVLTVDVGAFTAGAVTVVIHYIKTTGPTS